MLIALLWELTERAGRDPSHIQIAARHPMKVVERLMAYLVGASF